MRRNRSTRTSPLAGFNLEVVGDAPSRVVALEARIAAGIQKAADLCSIEPPVCQGNLGIPRAQMPQLEPAVVQRFLGDIQARGVKVKDTKKAVGTLKATQREINASKVAGMAKSYLAGTFPSITDPIIVSRDDYVLDGHHRWAALTIVNPAKKMEVWQVDMPIDRLLAEANSYEGVGQAGFAQNPDPLPYAPDRYFTHPRGTRLVPVSALSTIRARPTGIENAAKYMRWAYEGKKERRKPISVTKMPGGRWKVLDGNSTVAIARMARWPAVYALPVKGVS